MNGDAGTTHALAPSLGRTVPLAPRTGVVRVLSPWQRVGHAAIALLWILVNVRFWSYWLDGSHVGEPWIFAATTAGLAYLTVVVPSIYWFYVAWMRRPHHRPAPPGMRVAMVTLCVPSHESSEVIRRQLDALPAVDYPHDSWVLDEGDDPEVRAYAKARGVRYFTRKGVPRWNQQGPPFQTKTKAGNVNAWLDHLTDIGEDYDAFVQLDVDHVPRPEYLDLTLGHLAHPRVAWVQAPSVFANLDVWTARGAGEQDMVLQGPLQMGFFGLSRTPLIIGSHTTYRTAAVREIGGFQPTRAEDHLDTVVLAGAGYTGVLVPEVIAEGEGPEDFVTYLRQQFAWAYSMTQILFERMPRLVRSYRPRQMLELLTTESWYTLFAISFAALWALPVFALVTDSPIARLALSEFLAYHLPVMATLTLMWWWAREWFQPPGILLSWRSMILELARWPVVLWAVVNAVLGIRHPYMITPKGHRGELPSALHAYGPYVTLSVISIAAIGGWHAFVGEGEAQGYLAFVVLNLVALLAMLYTVVGLELRDARPQFDSLAATLGARAGFLAVLLLLTVAGAIAGASAWGPVAEVIR